MVRTALNLSGAITAGSLTGLIACKREMNVFADDADLSADAELRALDSYGRNGGTCVCDRTDGFMRSAYSD